MLERMLPCICSNLVSSLFPREVVSVKVGVVGCGRIATLVHLPSLTRIQKIDVVAAVDTNKERLHETLEKFHIEEGYDDYLLMLKRADVDTVFVCTPPQQHFQIVMDSIQHNKHVFCEKPIATAVEEAATIKTALEKRNREDSDSLVLMPGHNFVFTPCFVEALQRVKDGEIGSLQKIVSCATSNLMFYGAKTDFRIHAKGGVIEDQLPHIAYLCHEAGGPLERVVSIDPRRRGHTFVDDASVEIELASGIQASLSARWSGLIPALKFDLLGDSGQIKMDLLRTPYNIILVEDGESRTIRMGRRFQQYFDVLRNKHPSYFLEHMHLLRCVEGADKARVTIDDGINLVRTLSEVMTIFEESPYSPVGMEKVVIVKAEDDVGEAVQKSIHLLGGLNIKRDERVVVKPNVCYHKNLNNMIITDPRVLETVISLVKKRTDNIVVVESDNNSGTADERVRQSGVMDLIERCGVEFLNLCNDETEEHDVDGLTLKIPKTVLKADFFINIPKVKTCNIEHTFVTIAMKNMFGTLANRKKQKLHKKLMEVLLFLNRTIRQNLIIVDGIVGMQGLGPIQGNPVDLGLVISGLNPVTVDAACCHIMGINPYAVEPLWKAYKAGIGEIDIDRIQILGEKINSVTKKFDYPMFSPNNVFTALKTTVRARLGKA